jgi:hypothetical protein
MLSKFPHTAIVTAPPRSRSFDFPSFVSIRVNAHRSFFAILFQHCNVSLWSGKSTSHDPDTAVSSGAYLICNLRTVLLHPGVGQPRVLEILLGDIVFGDEDSASTVLCAVREAGSNTNGLRIWVAESNHNAVSAGSSCMLEVGLVIVRTHKLTLLHR